jgi:hypothetical protein
MALNFRLQREASSGKGLAFGATLQCDSCNLLCDGLADGWPFRDALAVIPDPKSWMPGIEI